MNPLIISLIIPLIIPLLITIVILFCSCIHLFNSRRILQRKLSVVKSMLDVHELRLTAVEAAQKQELTQDQIDYKKKVEAQYATLFDQIQKSVKTTRSEMSDLVASSLKKSREEFNDKLVDEFDKACEQIKFNEIEYKKTITKKRKDFSRKHGKDAKPRRIWRYIDEE